MAKYLLGIDNGMTVAKAALFTLDGREVAVASEKTEMITPHPGHYERDAEALWRATADSIKKAIADAGIDPKEIAAVACTGHGNGLYLVDKDGNPVRNAIGSTDSRAQSYVERWAADGVDKAIRPKTMQSIWAAQPNALLSWLRDNEPETMARACWVLMCKDFVRSRLTGKFQMELTDMSGTSLMNVGTGEYDVDVLEAFGIPEMRDLLPPIVRTEEICGEVTARAAEQTGLAAGTPVAGGLFDIDACSLASGILDAAPLCMIAGTWGINQYIATTPVVDGVFMTTRYSKPGYYLMTEGSATSGSNLEWFATEFFGAEAEQAKARGESIYDLCSELVAATGPEEGEMTFVPFLYGSHAEAAAKSCLIGMAGWQSRGHVLRAIYEGVVFGHRTHVDRLLKYRDMPERIRLTGGAVRSDVWVQIFADIFQVPVEIPKGTELGALGAAIAAGVAAGCFESYDAAVGAMVGLSRIQLPNMDLADLYRAKYERYTRVISTLGPLWSNSG